MSGFTQFLGAIAGQVASRVILNKVANVGLSQSREPAREPGAYQLPVVIPKGAEFDTLSAGIPSSRYKIPNWLFFTGYGALLWYAANATAPVDIPDLGDPGPEEALLFPGLKRELTQLDVEDISTSDDPVEACLERVGWKLDRIDELRQSIFEKEQVDLFTTPEPLTRSEGELLEAIETCMQRLEIQYGSLEAAGVVCSDCGNDPDLGVVQREMFDPEQIEIDFPEQITITLEQAEAERSILNKKAIENLKKAAAISPGLKYDVPKPGRTLSHDIATHYLNRNEVALYKLLNRVIWTARTRGNDDPDQGTPKKEMRDTLRELDGETIEIPEGHVHLKVWEKGGEFRLYVKLDSPKYNKIKDIGYITDKAWGDEQEYKGLAYSQKTSDVVGGYKIMEKVVDKILLKHRGD